MDAISADRAPRRPALRYHGGKWRLAPWVIGFFPPHRIYVEPFGGAASVLMRKPRSYAEVYNDLDSEVVNVFRILSDPAQSAELERLVRLTPFARDEFEAAYSPPQDHIQAAHKMIVRSFMGFGSAAMTRTHVTGFRKNSSRNGTNAAQDWCHWPDQMLAFVDRLRGVVIENKPAAEMIPDHDREDTLFYVDPPYPWSTRNSLAGRGRIGVKHGYRCEMDDADHAVLAAVLRNVRGMVVISGYPCDLYDRELYPDRQRHERSHLADGARQRTEVVWLNPACAERSRQINLFNRQT